MAPYHEDNYFIVAPGSQTTLVQLGLGESYGPPTIEVPTKVFKHSSIPDGFSSKGDESDAVYPIVKGEIVDIKAFNYFLKVLYRSILKKRPEGSNIPFLLISSSKWSRLEIELITHYVFENCAPGAFTVMPSALGAIYAYGAEQNALIIDIGYDKTEIIPVVDLSVVESAKKVIPFGGNSINESLQKALPNLSVQQIEQLKKSPIYEVLSDEDKKKSFFGMDGLKQNDEDNFDVAAIVTSGRTREILEEREKHGEEKAPNSQLETNSFIDIDGNEITVGKERFRGSEELISYISKAVHESLSKIVDLNKRQECWDHLILLGRTSKINGFFEALNTQLVDDHLIGKEYHQSAAQQAFQSTVGTAITFSQVPNSIKFSKMPEYFPEWKKQGYSNVSFLGGQIVSKQIFSTNNDNMFVTKSAYSEKGPLAIWDLAF